MLTIVYIENNEEGKEVAIAEVKFNLGDIADESKVDKGTIFVGMGTNGMKKFYEHAIYERLGGKIDYQDYIELLEQYVTFALYEKIGVSQSPIKRNRDGEIEGFEDEVEIVEGYLK